MPTCLFCPCHVDANEFVFWTCDGLCTLQRFECPVQRDQVRHSAYQSVQGYKPKKTRCGPVLGVGSAHQEPRACARRQ